MKRTSSTLERVQRVLVISACAIAAACHVNASFAVDVWLTTGDKSSLLAEQPDLSFQAGSGSGGFTINVTPTTTYQTIQGFGAALTDSSAWLIENELSTSQRNDLMDDLFDANSGIGLNYLRLPMGASDFTASGFYTYNDLLGGQTDTTQSQFSIAHDQQYIIPQLQQAFAINPNLQLMGSPWSAPAWMKTNGSLIGGSLQTQYYDSYSKYLQRFIEDYAAEGLAIDAITLQNEPLFTPSNYPGMSMTSSQQADLIKNHIGPDFAAADIDTKIVLYDHNWDNTSYAIDTLNDPAVKQYVAGTAFHGYAGSVDAQSTVRDAHPDRGIYFTEITGGDFAPNFSDNLVFGIENIIIGNMRNWGETALYWNLALNEQNGPHLGGCSNCRGVVTIDSASGDVTFNEEYYTLAHASKFVQAGAVRIDSRTINDIVETVAFQNPDGSMALIALNPSGSSKEFRVVEDGEHFSYQLPAKAVATFVWPSVNSPTEPIELLANPEFDNSGQNWSSLGQTGFHSFFGDNEHASLFTDNPSNSGSIFQTGIVGEAGQTYVFELSDTRIEANADADVRLGLEFWNADETIKLGETLELLELPGVEVNGGVFSINAVAPEGTEFVRPVISFDNVVSSGSQSNIFVFQASLMAVIAEGDFDADGDVDGADFLSWQRNPSIGSLAGWEEDYGSMTPMQGAIANVPEPGSCFLAMLGLSLFLRIRRI